MKDRVAIQYLEETCTWLKKMRRRIGRGASRGTVWNIGM